MLLTEKNMTYQQVNSELLAPLIVSSTEKFWYVPTYFPYMWFV